MNLTVDMLYEYLDPENVLPFDSTSSIDGSDAKSTRHRDRGAARLEKDLVTDGIEDPGNGLRRRWARPGDDDTLVAFHGDIHRGADGEEQGAFIADWFRTIASGLHPTFSIADTTVVEQNDTGGIVSSLSLIPERWSYDGIPIDVGRIEFVSTRPDMRRGLVRRQMEIVHRLFQPAGAFLRYR